MKKITQTLVILFSLQVVNCVAGDNALENQLTYLESCWWNQQTTDTTREELASQFLKLARNTSDAKIKLRASKILWENSGTKEKYYEELIHYFFEVAQNDNNENYAEIKISALAILWNDSQTRKIYHKKLTHFYLTAIGNIANEDTILGSLATLWNDFQTRESYRDELIPLYLNLIRNSNKQRIRSQALFQLWNDHQTKEKCRDELTSYYLDTIRNVTDDEYALSNALVSLWKDLQTREVYREELIRLCLRLLKNTKEQYVRSQTLHILRDDLQVKNKLHEKLNNLLLDSNPNQLTTESRERIIILLSVIPEILDKYELILQEIFKRQIEKEPNNILLKLEAYLYFGNPFEEEYTQFLLQNWAKMNAFEKQNILERLTSQFDVDNPRMQQLLLLYANSIDGRFNSLAIYANLLKKMKEDSVHYPSLLSLSIQGQHTKTLHFVLNPQIFSYLPIKQQALATLEDVDIILGNIRNEITQKIREDSQFTEYFKEPFSEEALMLQAMVKKFKIMGEAGKKKLETLMIDMAQCKSGKNQAVWDHYFVESRPLFLADLKHITDWFLRLQEKEIPYLSEQDLSHSFKKTRASLSRLIMKMLQQDHIFRQHMTNLKTEEAKQLKALLGYFVYQEQSIGVDNRLELAQNLKQVVKILIDLSNPETFFENLERLCHIYEIYPPADKFGDQLSPEVIENLIQKLKASDVNGRSEVLDCQDQMYTFVKSNEFMALLQNFKDESGEKLRELISGYVTNGWAIGLLNLMTLANETTLEDAVDRTFELTTIDKDMPLTWYNLKKLLVKELVHIKRLCLNALVEKFTREKHANRPHDVQYIEDLLGGIIGLHNPKKIPKMDEWHMTHSNITSKSLQEALDAFHTELTPSKIIDHFNEMLANNKLSIIDPQTGLNIIWHMISLSAKEYLLLKGISDSILDIDELLYNENGKGATQLALAIFLTKIGILQEVDAENLDHITFPASNETIWLWNCRQ